MMPWWEKVKKKSSFNVLSLSFSVYQLYWNGDEMPQFWQATNN
jgi:hypothetical protein